MPGKTDDKDEDLYAGRILPESHATNGGRIGASRTRRLPRTFDLSLNASIPPRETFPVLGDDVDVIIQCGLFDLDWVCHQDQSDIFLAHSSLVGAIRRYLGDSALWRISPHPLFDPEYYLKNNPVLGRVEINPLVHFIRFGWYELFNPHPLHNTRFVEEQLSRFGLTKDRSLKFNLNLGFSAGLIDPHPLFDSSYYLQQLDYSHGDVHPLIHFLKSAPAFLKPSPWFEPQLYLDLYPDLRRHGVNPLVHFVVTGYQDGYVCNRPLAAAARISTDPDSELVALQVKGFGAQSPPSQFAMASNLDARSEENRRPSMFKRHPFWGLNVSPYQPLNARIRSDWDQVPRLNVLLPTLLMDKMSGGPNTVINLVGRLLGQGVKIRLISTCTGIDADLDSLIKHIAQQSETNIDGADLEIVSALEGKYPLQVGYNDVYLATAWWTAQMAADLARQSRHKKFLYFIQDFEPLFHASSSQYALALETYAFDIVPIVNSKVLLKFLSEEKIGRFADPAFVAAALVVEPAVSKSHFYYEPREEGDKIKRKLWFYARPTIGVRNLFELGVAGLRQAIQDGVFDPTEWDFLGVGEQFSPVELGQGATLRPVPWVNFTEYARQMRQIDILLSLMLSPHPSYPPLEAASCGAITVTNSFQSKSRDLLNSVSKNIVVVDAGPRNIAEGLATAKNRLGDIAARERNSVLGLPGTWSESFASAVTEISERLQRIWADARSDCGDLQPVTLDPGYIFESEQRAHTALRKMSAYSERLSRICSWPDAKWAAVAIQVENQSQEDLIKSVQSVVNLDGRAVRIHIVVSSDARCESKQCVKRLGHIYPGRIELHYLTDHKDADRLSVLVQSWDEDMICILPAGAEFYSDALKVLKRQTEVSSAAKVIFPRYEVLTPDERIEFVSPPTVNLHDLRHKPKILPVLIDKQLLARLLNLSSREDFSDLILTLSQSSSLRDDLFATSPEVIVNWQQSREHWEIGGDKVSTKNHRSLNRLHLIWSDENPELLRNIVGEFIGPNFKSTAVNSVEWVDSKLLRIVSNAAKESDSPVCLLLGNQQLIDPTSIGHALGLMRDHPHIAVVGGPVVQEGVPAALYLNSFSADSQRYTAAVLSANECLRLPDHPLLQTRVVSGLAGVNLIVRPSVLSEAIKIVGDRKLSYRALTVLLSLVAARTGRSTMFIRSMLSFATNAGKLYVTHEDIEEALGVLGEGVPSGPLEHVDDNSVCLKASVGQVYDGRDLLRPKKWDEGFLVSRVHKYLSSETYKFSIITPIYSGSDPVLLQRAAESVLEQRYGNWEWIIAAQGSLGRKLDSALKNIEQSRLARGRVRIIRPRKNLGIIQGMKLCLDSASGDYILPLDGDDILTVDALKIFGFFAENGSKPAIMFSDEVSYDSLDRNCTPFVRGRFDPVLAFENSYIWHALAFRRDHAARLGIYSNQDAEFCHDWDTVLRFYKVGYEPLHIPEVLYYWRAHSRSTTNRENSSNSNSQNSVRGILLNNIKSAANSSGLGVSRFLLDRGAPEWCISGAQLDPDYFVLCVSKGLNSGSVVNQHPSVGDVRYVSDVCLSESTKIADLSNILESNVHISDSKWVLFKDSRISLAGNIWSGEIEKLFRLHPNLAAVGGRVVGTDSIVYLGPTVFGEGSSLIQPFSGIDKHAGGPFSMLLKPQLVDLLSLAFMAVRMDVLISIVNSKAAAQSLETLPLVLTQYIEQEAMFLAYSPVIEGTVDLSVRNSLIDDYSIRGFSRRQLGMSRGNDSSKHLWPSWFVSLSAVDN
jgi:glycosyltransferase involved in cell wall biosynthesis